MASFAAKESERNVEERLDNTKPLDDLKTRECELRCEKEGLQIILKIPRPPTKRQRGRVEETNEKPVRLQVMIEEREKA